jgi:hypothetical protein
MSSIVIKLIDKNKPDLVDQARGELEGAGYAITYEDNADFVGVEVKNNDSNDGGNNDDEQVYNDMVVLIGKK